MMTIPGWRCFLRRHGAQENVLATLMQSFAITCLITLLWWVIGYSLAFTPGSPYLGGVTRAFMNGMTVMKDANKVTVSHLGHDDSRNRLFHVPADVCHHHSGAHRGRLCRSHEVLGDAGIHGGLVAAGVLPHRSLGLGAVRLAGRQGAYWTTRAAQSCTSMPASPVLASCLVLGKRLGYGKEAMPPHNLTLTLIRRLAVVGGLVRLQRGPPLLRPMDARAWPWLRRKSQRRPPPWGGCSAEWISKG